MQVAVEATTGWRFVVEEVLAAGMTPRLAEPAETKALRGRKRRAKTDRADAHHLRVLLAEGRLPEAWIAPESILELRAKVRLRKALMDERTAWQQRIHSLLFHHGIPRPARLLGRDGRALLADLELPAGARETLQVALTMIDYLEVQLDPLNRELVHFARHQAGCRALMKLYGVGELISVALVAELGDVRRFSSSKHAVRFAGLDVTVYESDDHRAPGHLSRQGSPLLRWAAYEATITASRSGSPDRSYYEELAQRLGKSRAKVALARKLIRRAHHILRDLGEEALAPALA